MEYGSAPQDGSGGCPSIGESRGKPGICRWKNARVGEQKSMAHAPTPDIPFFWVGGSPIDWQADSHCSAANATATTTTLGEKTVKNHPVGFEMEEVPAVAAVGLARLDRGLASRIGRPWARKP